MHMKQSRQSKRILSLIVSFVLLLASVCALTACGKTLESIEITTAPAVTRYMAGETFKPDGMVVTAKYSDGSSEAVEGYTYDLTAPLKETDTLVTISYEGLTATVAIKVSNPITGISIKTHATKTTYKSGEVFDPAGMVITVTYYDESTKDVAIADLAGVTYSTESLKVGQTEVAIKYEGMTATETITVTRGNLIETAVDNDFVSTKSNSLTYVYGSNGFDCHEEIYLNNGTTGPETGYKGFDQVDRWVTYTFELTEAGKVDLVWKVAGSDWVGSTTENPGVDDLSLYFTITLGDLNIDVEGIVLPGGDGEEIPVWWNTQSLVIKDVELPAGKHTFKAVCHGGSGVNVDSMTVYSDAAFKVEETAAISSANLVSKENKPYLLVKGTYSGYAEKDFSMNLVKLADQSTIALTSTVTLKDGGIFEIEADLSDVAISLGDLIAKVQVKDKALDLEFAGSADGNVEHVTLNSKFYMTRYEAAKTSDKPILILTVDSAFDASVDQDFVSSKANSVVLNYYSAGTVTTGQLKEESGAPTGGLGNLGSDTSYVVYKFKLAESGLVDLVLRAAGSTWRSGNVNAGVSDLSKAATLTIDETSIGVSGIELPGGDGSDASPKWWNMKNIVLKNVELSKGEHTFKLALLGNGGVNVGDLTVYSDKAFVEIAELDSQLVKGSLDETDKSTKVNKIEFLHGSNGFACHEDVFQNNGTTGPELGLKGFENGRWITYTFALEEEATVDFIWQVSGSNWQPGNVNEGVSDLFNATAITIDGVRVDVRGYELPAGNDNNDPNNLVWWYYYDIVIENVTLSAGVHTFRADSIGNGGLNVSFLKVYSDATLRQMSGYKAERYEVSGYETEKTTIKQYVGIGDGVAVSNADDVYERREGQTGPEHGIKGLDTNGRWLSYTFTLEEDSLVDFVWTVCGSRWIDMWHNGGVDDLSQYAVITIDGKVIDFAGIALPGGEGELEQIWWNLYDVVIKDVTLSAGEHTFKIYCLGTAGINIKSMNVATAPASAE